ncbi:hypothetical protein [Gordonibacter sp.]|uniref:hypothetical protein n=1 Tax=Gordonibacter sp. TaxID=1968902 RepID=UPI0025C22A37|nr:hypothetical protein [Gordonibacter sp.]
MSECVVDKWDKDVESVTLYAHWTLQIDCAIPTSVDIEVDASGTSTTSATPEFSSSTPADIKVTAVSSTQGADAATLFANNVAIGVGIQLKPASSGLPVTVPLTSTGTTIPNNGWTIAAGSTTTPTKFAVAFSLSLPSETQLNYRPNTPVTVANLSYVIKLASAS